MHLSSSIIVLAAALSSVLVRGHVEMAYPPPRGSKHNTGYQPIDYNLNAPLSSLVSRVLVK